MPDTVASVAGRLSALEAQVRSLKNEVAKKDRALHARNVALDGMAWVWCDGGCKGGVFRFSDTQLTGEMLHMIERNTERLKRWAANRDYRRSYPVRDHLTGAGDGPALDGGDQQ
jgi:hypothetical protein